jgi:chromosome condensin MukBEF complex kleisin-like MukF subunit
MTPTIKALEDYIADKQAKIDRLIEWHGQGVRPGWVGEEIAILDYYIRDARNAINELEKDNAND